MPQTMTFGELRIAYDDRILSPRPWTELQARWAADLLRDPPDGPVLELGAGAGQIGLLAVHTQARQLVCVDSSEVACDYARRNAAAAGVAELVDVRERAMADALEPEERFALILADPPWVPTGEVDRHPEDPAGAIDGGEDGLDVARTCVHLAASHLLPGGSILMQLGTPAQADRLGGFAADRGLTLAEVRQGDGGVVARLQLS